MATNSIFPFAGDSTNILTTEEYLTDAQRLSGHIPGIARSQLANKEAKQATIIATGVAQFLADNQATNVQDELTPAELSSMMDAAITSSIPTATVDVAGKVELATPEETQAGTDAARAVTSAGLASVTSTQTRRGLIERATDAETQAGTDTTRAITPANLSSRTATTTRTGVVELATDAEAIAGVSADLSLTPANLTAVINQFTASAASTPLPGGLIIKTGTATSGNSVATIFATPFPTACFTVQAITASRFDNIGLTVKSASGFTMDCNNTGSNVYWLAVGY